MGMSPAIDWQQVGTVIVLIHLWMTRTWVDGKPLPEDLDFDTGLSGLGVPLRTYGRLLALSLASSVSHSTSRPAQIFDTGGIQHESRESMSVSIRVWLYLTARAPNWLVSGSHRGICYDKT